MVVLEVAIGLVFVFALLGLVTSALGEVVTQLLSLRAKNLRVAVQRMLDDDGKAVATDALYGHPIIRAFSKDSRKSPSYIPKGQFARVLLKELPKLAADSSGAEPGNLAELRALIGKLESEQLRGALNGLIDETATSLSDVNERIEEWFDDTMARASGWFQRRIGRYLALIGVVLVVFTNADAIRIARTLYLTPELREVVVARAEARVAESNDGEDGASTEEIPLDAVIDQNLSALGPLLGWSDHDAERLLGIDNDDGIRDRTHPVYAWFEKLIGLALSVVAVSLGAPFWFDLLGKLVSLRSSIREPVAVEQKDHGRGAV